MVSTGTSDIHTPQNQEVASNNLEPTTPIILQRCSSVGAIASKNSLQSISGSINTLRGVREFKVLSGYMEKLKEAHSSESLKLLMYPRAEKISENFFEAINTLLQECEEETINLQKQGNKTVAKKVLLIGLLISQSPDLFISPDDNTQEKEKVLETAKELSQACQRLFWVTEHKDISQEGTSPLIKVTLSRFKEAWLKFEERFSSWKEKDRAVALEDIVKSYMKIEANRYRMKEQFIPHSEVYEGYLNLQQDRFLHSIQCVDKDLGERRLQEEKDKLQATYEKRPWIFWDETKTHHELAIDPDLDLGIGDDETIKEQNALTKAHIEDEVNNHSESLPKTSLALRVIRDELVNFVRAPLPQIARVKELLSDEQLALFTQSSLELSKEMLGSITCSLFEAVAALQAPARTQESQGEVVRLQMSIDQAEDHKKALPDIVEFVLRKVEQIKQDVLSFKMKVSNASVVNFSIEEERGAFNEWLSKYEMTMDTTQYWLEDVSKHCADFGISSGELRSNYQTTLSTFLVFQKMLESPSGFTFESIPETFIMDVSRINDLRMQWQNMVRVGTALTIFKSPVCCPLATPEDVEELSKLIVGQIEKDAPIDEEILVNSMSYKAREIIKRNGGSASSFKETTFKTMLSTTLSSGTGISGVIKKRFRDYMNGALTRNKFRSELLQKLGLASLEDSFKELVGKSKSLFSYNLFVHFSRYRELIQRKQFKDVVTIFSLDSFKVENCVGKFLEHVESLEQDHNEMGRIANLNMLLTLFRQKIWTMDMWSQASLQDQELISVLEKADLREFLHSDSFSMEEAFERVLPHFVTLFESKDLPLQEDDIKEMRGFSLNIESSENLGRKSFRKEVFDLMKKYIYYYPQLQGWSKEIFDFFKEQGIEKDESEKVSWVISALQGISSASINKEIVEKKLNEMKMNLKKGYSEATQKEKFLEPPALSFSFNCFKNELFQIFNNVQKIVGDPEELPEEEVLKQEGVPILLRSGR
jgi:hypothetical protein